MLKPTNKTQELIRSFFDKEKYYEKIRNMAIIAHVDHGKSTLVDNLLAASKLVSDMAVGGTATDVDSQERARGITIDNAVVTFLFNDYLFNLVDTPGHVDFGAEVAKSLRCIDGAVLVMDSIEGVMVQTEAVISKALEENVDLILMINKVDRLIIDLKLDPQKVYLKLISNINQVNNLIRRITSVEKDYFSLEKNVVFGSALNKWAFTIQTLQKNQEKFSDFTSKLIKKEPISEEYELSKVLLGKCAEVFKNPLETHESNTRNYFKDENETIATEITKEFLNSPLEQPFRGIITDINYDKIMGLLHTVRVVSGNYDKTKSLYSSQDGYKDPIKGPTRISVGVIDKLVDIDCAKTGSIVIMQGAKIEAIGTTISQKKDDLIKYPSIKYMRDPILSVAVYPEKTSELTKMIDCIKILCIEDPTLHFKQDETAKEYILSGVGALHLEVSLKRIELKYGVKIKTSSPKVPYVEALNDDIEKSESTMKRTPNKHNDFNFYMFNLPAEVTKRLLNGEISAKNLNVFLEKHMPRDLAKAAVKEIDNGNIYFDLTHGADFMQECKTLISKSLSFSLNTGVKLPNPLKGIGIAITFAKIHETPLHRTQIQLRSAFREGIEEILKEKNPSIIKEPIMRVTIRLPMAYSEKVQEYITNKRGVLSETKGEDYSTYVQDIYIIPLAETLELSTKLMALTEGRASCIMQFSHLQKVPEKDLKEILKTNK